MGSEGAPDRVLVVGAGLAGLICAHRLQTHGIDVTVLEKGRGPGGRQSTRRETLGEHDLTFDHGAQYFTVRDPEFARFLAPFREGDEPVVRTWDTSIVSIESVHAGLARALAEPVRTLYSTRVHTCRREDDTWILVDEEDAELARGAALVITAPAAQALALLPDEAPLRNRLRAMRYAPCWTVMVHFPRSLEQDYGGAFVDRSPLSWIADNDSKPGRNPDGAPGESWVLHGSPEWSYAHLEDTPEDVADALLVALSEAIGHELPTPDLVRAHRWRYALPTMSAEEPCLWDEDWQLAVAGDGCPAGARVEGAFLSGWTAARRIRLDREDVA